MKIRNRILIFFFWRKKIRSHTQKLTATIEKEYVSFYFSPGTLVDAIELFRVVHLHIGVTPTSGADTPAYIP